MIIRVTGKLRNKPFCAGIIVAETIPANRLRLFYHGHSVERRAMLVIIAAIKIGW